MKKTILFFAIAITTQTIFAQGILDKIKNAVKTDTSKNILTTIKNATTKTGTGSGTGLSNTDIVSGLREALRVATDTTAKTLSAAGGYFKNEAIKIIMPAEAVKAEKTLRSMGAGALVDKAILTMNSAAENAATEVGPIFLTAIKQMTLTDGLSILKGGDNAATNFLKNATTAALIEKMKPVIQASLQKVNAEKAWTAVFSKYNMFSQQKVNTDLTGYVTQKALDGMFFNIALQEQKIRKDPAAQVTDILKKVFSK
jgi:Protein of unknown function (DUF4197)